MEWVDFKEANKTLLPPNKMPSDIKCTELRIYNDGQRCLSKWKMNWKDRLSALIYGNIWLDILSGETQPPVAIKCTKTMFEKQ
jgi:hypothetical protein